MTFMDAYKDVWRRYAQFDGRTSVGGFWRPVAINFLLGIGAGILMGIFIAADINILVTLIGIVIAVYELAIIVPSLALAIRRLHDTNKSGWMILVGLIPIIGWILVLIWYIQGGDPGANQYGPPPVGAQWSTDGFAPGAAYVAQAPGTPPPPPPASY